MSERKISSIMKQMDCHSKYGRKRGKNVHSSPYTQKYIAENLYPQLNEEERKQEIWSMDFTEEKIKGKKIFTCGIISVNRKILVGYTQADKCTAQLAADALGKAIKEYGAPYMVMTDRGAQFTSKLFYDMMQENKIRHSMSRPYTPIDNRFIETFWKSMKVELGKVKHLTTQTYAMVVDYYIYYYNNLRPHSSLNYIPPMKAFRWNGCLESTVI